MFIAFVTTKLGAVHALQVLTYNVIQDYLRLHLFVNNIVPTRDDTLASYQECTAAGYGSIVLLGSNWTFQVDPAAQVATATFPMQTFALTSSVSVFGYYITNQVTNVLLVAERFTNAPFQIVGNGNVFITPKLRLM